MTDGRDDDERARIEADLLQQIEQKKRQLAQRMTAEDPRKTAGVLRHWLREQERGS